MRAIQLLNRKVGLRVPFPEEAANIYFDFSVVGR